MRAPLSDGTCLLCSGVFSRTVMTRHLRGCGQPKVGRSAAPRQSSGKDFHLFVEGRYARAYWLHVAVPVEAPLGRLDDFLRRIWLECCGHLSAFSTGGRRYSLHPTEDFAERDMRVSMDQVVEVGTKLLYEYDYGSTTELALKVVGLRERETKAAVKLLARNQAPLIGCDRCRTGKQASQICTQCVNSGKGWLCEECAGAHACDRDTFLPVANSPRAGVCGYTG